jgi:hypothetical protein
MLIACKGRNTYFRPIKHRIGSPAVQAEAVPFSALNSFSTFPKVDFTTASRREN